MEALGRWKNPLHDRQLYLSFLCLLLHVTVAEEKSEEEESEREKKEKRRETRLIRFSWRVGARGRRGERVAPWGGERTNGTWLYSKCRGMKWQFWRVTSASSSNIGSPLDIFPMGWESSPSLARVYGVTCTINRGPLYALMVLRDIFYGAEEILARDKDLPRVERLYIFVRVSCYYYFFALGCRFAME